MLLQRKSLAFVAPSGEKYLIFMLLKVRKWTVVLPAKNYQNSLKHALLWRKKLHWPLLIWPTLYVTKLMNIEHLILKLKTNKAILVPMGTGDPLGKGMKLVGESEGQGYKNPFRWEISRTIQLNLTKPGRHISHGSVTSVVRATPQVSGRR